MNVAELDPANNAPEPPLATPIDYRHKRSLEERVEVLERSRRAFHWGVSVLVVLLLAMAALVAYMVWTMARTTGAF